VIFEIRSHSSKSWSILNVLSLFVYLCTERARRLDRGENTPAGLAGPLFFPDDTVTRTHTLIRKPKPPKPPPSIQCIQNSTNKQPALH
jgi:hypothetical protein